MNAIDFTNRAAAILDRVVPAMVPMLPEGIDEAYFAGFMRRNRRALVDQIATVLRHKAAKSYAPPPGEPEAWTVRERTEANLAAMRIIAANLTSHTAAQRAVLAAYSGWGGLSLNKVANQFPAGVPRPEARGLVHEYYTPLRAWRAVADHLRQSGRFDGTGELRALEPSVGIGRALRAFDGWPIRWTTVEASEVSSRLVTALVPDQDHHRGFFEGYAATHPDERFDLVISNPPYGARGAAKEQDEDDRYDTKRAYLYFMYRALDLLHVGGVGVFIVPTGWLTGRGREMRASRERLLKTHHLLEAFRLPSHPPDGGTRADVVYEEFVVDALFFERRPQPLADVPEADLGVLEGGYFAARPGDVLGTPFGEDEGWEPGMPKPRRGFQLEGVFRSLPAWNPRAMATGEAAIVEKRRTTKVRGGIDRTDLVTDALPPDLEQAVALGLRIDGYLARVAAGDDLAVREWDELRRDALEWRGAHGDPLVHTGLRELADRRSIGAARFLVVWERGGRLGPALANKPAITIPYRGATTPDAFCRWLYAQRGGNLSASIAADAWARSAGSPVTAGAIQRSLLSSGWCLDGDAWDELHPDSVYYTGFLWPKYDRATAPARAGDQQAQAQAKRLRELIGWRAAPSIIAECAPTDSWLPVDIVSEFVSEALKAGRHDLERQFGLLQPKGVSYATLVNTEKGRTSGFSRDFLSFLGWTAADNGLWNPEREEVDGPEGKEKEPVVDARRRQAQAWTTAWSEWAGARDDIQNKIEDSYNRTMRGYVDPVRSQLPLPVARWAPVVRDGRRITLHAYQNEAANKLAANHGGLLAFDVGLGKTFTGLNLLAYARQEGWARRPVVVVPNSIVWKWAGDFAMTLPSYRVLVIGAERRFSKHLGRTISEPDSPETRARKWAEFQAGQWDVVLLTYSALGRQRIDPEFVQRYVNQTIALKRSIAMTLEARQSEEEKAEAKEVKKQGGKPSERKTADIAERMRAWVGDILSPPKGQAYDPGVDWHQLGIDFLMVDEAQNFKNLFTSARETMASDTDTKRAWALDFRCASVREHSAGAGVVLLSATPAKNAAVEFYTLLHLVNPKLWSQVAIDNPEDFVGRYAKFQLKRVVDGSGTKVVTKDVVVGFRNLEELRGVVYRWATFRTADEVGLKLPEVRVQQHLVRVNDAQHSELARAYIELAEIEEKLKKTAFMDDGGGARQALMLKKQGIALRIYAIYLHPYLPGATKRGDADSLDPHDGPKLIACVDQVVATAAKKACTIARGQELCLDCGHIIFADNIAVHGWVRQLLVERGIPEHQIAILNAIEAKDLERRQEIVRQFNGVGVPGDDDYLAPSVQVVIANAVAYEGMDLQRRTCAIHHLDVPWEPATLQQRNGRGVRQGNLFDAVDIHYYFVEGSNESWKVQRIERKRGWMAALVEGQARSTNTTMSDAAMAAEPDEDEVEDASLAHAPPEVRERIQEARRKQKETEKAAKTVEAQKAANRELQRAADMWRRARVETDPMKLTAVRAAAEDAMNTISKFRSDLWTFDWHALARRVREETPFIPVRGPPIYPGDQFEWGNVGVLEAGVQGVDHTRDYKRNAWVEVPALFVRRLNSFNHMAIPRSEEIETWQPSARADSVSQAVKAYDPRYDDLDSWRTGRSQWSRLAPSTQEAAWPLLLGAFARIAVPYRGALPVERGGRLLVLASTGTTIPADASLIPSTDSGWARFLALLRKEEKEPEGATSASMFWWGRRIPRKDVL